MTAELTKGSCLKERMVAEKSAELSTLPTSHHRRRFDSSSFEYISIARGMFVCNRILHIPYDTVFSPIGILIFNP